jgi:threonine dehydrogenase-like Zn-dependent dehydrogenase
MKAVAVLPEAKQVKLVDHPEPKITRPTEVKVKILDVGICGTDKEICSFQYGTPPAGSEYLVIGHESLGEVVEVGSAVSKVKKGDLVVPTVRRQCSENCPACRVGRQDFCFTGKFTERGIGMAHGFMTELVVDEDRNLNRLEPQMRDVGVLVEPLTIAEKALKQVWDVQDRLPWFSPNVPETERGYQHNAVVLGAGPVGLLGAMALVNSGFKTYVYSLEAPPHPKADVCKTIGATYVCAAQVNLDQLAEMVGNIDYVYEATGASKLSFEMVKRLGVNGCFCFTGVPGRKAPVEMDTDLLMRNMVLKNQLVYGTVNANREAFEAAIKDLTTFRAKWGDAVRTIITQRHPIDAAPELLVGNTAGIKNVISVAS